MNCAMCIVCTFSVIAHSLSSNFNMLSATALPRLLMCTAFDHILGTASLETYLEEEGAHVRVLALGLLEAGEVISGEYEVAFLPVPAAEQGVAAVPENAFP